MPESKTIVFSYKEVLEALIKYNNIHDGIWQLYVEFGLSAQNVQMVGKEGPEQVSPAAIVPIKSIGLTRVDKENPLAIDASIVNPE